MRDVTAARDDTGLHIEDHGGEGRPVVLIHGWPLSGVSWQPQIDPLLAEGYRPVTYDRRGFGRSAQAAGMDYGYDALADDLHAVLTGLELAEVTLVGFSMGGGEVARYLSRHGGDLVHSVVLAASVTPHLRRTEDNPDGPLTDEAAAGLRDGLRADRDTFFEEFTQAFYAVEGEQTVSEEQRQHTLRLCHQSDQAAALGCLEAFGTTDFRLDLERVTVPTLVLHGDADAIVALEGSGQLTHEAVAHSQLVVVPDAPHGLNVSHAREFNDALATFLAALA